MGIAVPVYRNGVLVVFAGMVVVGKRREEKGVDRLPGRSW